ncbi:MAG: hypothetical protein QNK36_10500 [Colwellia sp.]|nr:hypothetical protein [Colwellia sp.]
MDPVTMAFIIAMGVGGNIMDFFGAQAQREFNKMAGKLNESQLGVNMEFANVKAKDESLSELIALRKNLSHMSAVQNARGTNIGSGSALFVRQESEQVALKDEEMRDLNLKSTIATLKGQSVQNKLQTEATDINIKTGLSARIFNTLSAGLKSASNDSKPNLAPVSDGSSSFSRPGSSGGKRGGFGMTPV